MGHYANYIDTTKEPLFKIEAIPEKIVSLWYINGWLQYPFSPKDRLYPAILYAEKKQFIELLQDYFDEFEKHFKEQGFNDDPKQYAAELITGFQEFYSDDDDMIKLWIG